MSTTSREEQGMSITEKLAQALRGVVRVADRSTDEFDAAREALAEYDATPAVEVTADAVKRALKTVVIARGGGMTVEDYILEGGKKYWSPGSYTWPPTAQETVMQAALAAAFPALTQQVERLTAMNATSEKHFDRLTTLSAANARLAKDAERLDYLESLSADGVHVELCHQGSFSAGTLKVAATVFVGRPQAEFTGATIREAVDAATAQAKQEEGEK